MLCPKCGYNSFEHNITCPHCHRDLTPIRRQLFLTAPPPGFVNFFSVLSNSDDSSSPGYNQGFPPSFGGVDSFQGNSNFYENPSGGYNSSNLAPQPGAPGEPYYQPMGQEAGTNYPPAPPLAPPAPPLAPPAPPPLAPPAPPPLAPPPPPEVAAPPVAPQAPPVAPPPPPPPPPPQIAAPFETGQMDISQLLEDADVSLAPSATSIPQGGQQDSEPDTIVDVEVVDDEPQGAQEAVPDIQVDPINEPAPPDLTKHQAEDDLESFFSEGLSSSQPGAVQAPPAMGTGRSRQDVSETFMVPQENLESLDEPQDLDQGAHNFQALDDDDVLDVDGTDMSDVSDLLDDLDND